MTVEKRRSGNPVWRVFLLVLENFERFLVSSFLSLLAIVLILQVFMRFVLNDPLAWPEEFSRYLLIWTAFIGSSLAVKEGRFINIDILPSLASGWVKTAFHVIMHLGFLLFCGVAVYFSIDFISRVARSGQVSPAMGIPMWLVYVAAPVGLTMAALRTVQYVVSATTVQEHHYEEKS